MLRYDRPRVRAGRPAEPAGAQARRASRELLIITKANSRATVHRATYLDYIGVKSFDETGARHGRAALPRPLRLQRAYTESILHIPILAERVATAAGARRLHRRQPLRQGPRSQVLETYPRDELFQTDPDELVDIATAVLHLQERRKTKLFLRNDEYGRFVSCLVYLPRDRYNTTVRLKMEDILRAAFDGESVDYTTRVSESALARLHFVVRVPTGAADPRRRRGRAASAQIVDATRTWDEDLAEALRARRAARRPAARLIGLYGKAFPEAYKEDFSPRVAVDGPPPHRGARRTRTPIRLDLYQEPGCAAGRAAVQALPPRPAVPDPRCCRCSPTSGVEVIDERPYEITRSRRRHASTSTTSGCVRRRARSGASATSRDATSASGSRTPSARCGTGAPSPTASTPSSSAPG